MTSHDQIAESPNRRRSRRRWQRAGLALATILLLPTASYAQTGGSPSENAVTVLMTSFTGPIARGLSLVSIVVGGITFAFGEGGSKRLPRRHRLRRW